MKLPLVAAIAAVIAGLVSATSGSSYRNETSRPGAGSSHAVPQPTARADSTASKPKLQLPYVLLDIESPRYSPLLPLGTMFSSSGWPIVIRADASGNALGIATNALPPLFPAEHQTGYVVFADPDGCLELPAPFDSTGTPCAGLPSDETYLEFSNDVDQAGLADEADKGNRGRRAALADPAQSGQPVFHSVGDLNGDFVLEPVDAQVGPPTGESVDDGFGYGADDDFPGLVLLTPVGNGLVLDADFNRPAQKVERNLAGFLQWVGYELASATRNTVVRAGMIVPYGLVAPLMKTDDCIGGTAAAPACTDPVRFRIDGGPVTQLAGAGRDPFTDTYPSIFETRTYELRAFVVSGVAPSTLADLNNDGVVSARDATLAGYNVISNEKVVRFHQVHGSFCGGVPGGVNVFFDDVDGNGRATDIIVCPAGPGQITRIPR